MTHHATGGVEAGNAVTMLWSAAITLCGGALIDVMSHFVHAAGSDDPQSDAYA
jgi:hypothetical protein